MKIIKVDNYDRDNISDVLVCTEVDMSWGERVVKLLNASRFDADYFVLVEDDYELYDATQLY